MRLGRAARNDGSTVVDRYLDEVRLALPGPSSARRRALDEVRDHLIEERDHLVSRGTGAARAAVEATRALGPPRRLAAGRTAGDMIPPSAAPNCSHEERSATSAARPFLVR